MGYIDGEFVFIHGYGSGLNGEPYDSSTPQGQIYGCWGTTSVPFWCHEQERRNLVQLHYMERRARIFKPPTASYEDRYKTVALKLAAIWETKSESNEKRRKNPKFNCTRRVKKGKRKRKVEIASVYDSYREWLRVTKDFPLFLRKIVDDYFPMEDGPSHWDIGQIAYNSGGGSENKQKVRAILMKVDKIGQKLFPEPPLPEVEHGQSVGDEPTSSSDPLRSSFHDFDTDTSF